jgi:phosphate:Na+ symporter
MRFCGLAARISVLILLSGTLLAPSLALAQEVRLDFATGMGGEDVSGNGQIGICNELLARPLRIMATGPDGQPVSGVQVQFAVVEKKTAFGVPAGLPLIETPLATTGSGGYAGTTIRLGDSDGTFHIVCSPVNREGNPLIFSVRVYKRHWLAWMLVGLLGGLAIFLFGIKFGGRGLQKAAGGRLRDVVCRLTSNRFLGLLSGVIVTVIIQSSSATTAMMVSFANAGVIVLQQALGVILGADIGTTLTVQLIAFRIFDYALLFVLLGFVLFISKVERYSRVGQIVLGFGLLFFGMSVMASAVGPAKDHPAFVGFMLGVQRSAILAIIASAIFTAVIQSSAATIGLVLTFAFQGVITIESAIPLVLGANIGTCITALLASLGGGPEGRRIAWAHTFFKVIGVLLLLPFLGPFTRFVAGTAPSLTRQIANAHSLFNIGAALAFIPFVRPWAHLFRFLVKEEEVGVEAFKPVYLDRRVLDTPSLALGQATREVLRMADITYGVYSKSIDVFIKNDEALRERLIEEDDKIDALEEAITPYLTEISQKEMSDLEAQRAVALLFIVKNLELIGDIVSKSLMDLALKKILVSHRFSPEALERISQYHEQIEKTFQMAIDSLASMDKKLAREVVERKSEMNVLERELHKEHLSILRGRKDEVAETSTVFLDAISDLKRINSYASGIAYAVLGKI